MGEARIEHEGGWTDERVAELRRLWDTGDSAGRIAAILGGGVTRSAVLGKAMRLKLTKRGNTGLQSRAKNVARPRGQKGQPKVNAIVARASIPAKPLPAVEVLSSGIGLLALTTHTCCWPVGEATGSQQQFCGAHASLNDGQPYCPRHTAKAEYRR
jgi:GcrA cell cycle regulator